LRPGQEFAVTRATNTSASVYGDTVVLLSALAWPVAVLALFYLLHPQLVPILEVIPKKLAESTTVSVGSLSLQIEKKAEASGTPELADLITGLSQAAVEKLLETGKSSFALVSNEDGTDYYYLPLRADVAALRELARKRLLKFDVPWAEFETALAAANLAFGQGLGSEVQRVQRKLSAAQKALVTKQSYALSEKGERAFDLIVRSVGQQFNGPAPAHG
jgi:hypothetical protein